MANNSVSVVYKGVKYDTLGDLSRAEGLDRNVLSNVLSVRGYTDVDDTIARIKLGYDKNKKTEELVYKGERYNSVMDLCKSFGLSYNKVRQALNYIDDMSSEDIIDKLRNKTVSRKRVKSKSETVSDFDVLKDLITKLAIDSNLVRVKLNEGSSLYDALISSSQVKNAKE